MPDVNDLIARIRDRDDKVRCGAWLGAGEHGAAAVRPLVAVLEDADPEVRRAARNALWTIVRHAGRPGGAAEKAEKAAVERELCGIIGTGPAGEGAPSAAGPTASVASSQATSASAPSASALREILWMLGEIGGEAAVRAIRGIPGLLDAGRPEEGNFREDARCALQRIPGAASLSALKDALDAAPEDFKPALAAALRARGAEVPGVPDHKLVPTKATRVMPLEATPVDG